MTEKKIFGPGEGGRSGHGRSQRGGGRGSGGARRSPKGRGRDRGSQPLAEPPEGFFRALVLAPDREREGGGWPVISIGEEEDEGFRQELERRLVRRVPIVRRGREHGEWAVLRPDGLVPPRGRPRRQRALFTERHTAARPVVFRGILDPRERRELSGRDGERFFEPYALGPWLDARLPHGARRAEALAPEDPERDLERFAIEFGEHRLWVKSSRLSTFDRDRSVRLRVSFGEEGEDDASRDEARQVATGEIGRALFDATRAIEEANELRERLEIVLGGGVYFAQHIAYWNAPHGGALFHHDAFEEELEGGQRGVVYTQLDGATAWLALSLEDLAVRVGEFASWLEEDEDGELDELREELAVDGLEPESLRTLVGDWRGLRRELALPGCGRLVRLVNRGPEFTAFLADAGHAAVLEAGDAIYLPNHGLERTAMHSVFCAGPRPGLGLSLAVRGVRGKVPGA